MNPSHPGPDSAILALWHAINFRKLRGQRGKLWDLSWTILLCHTISDIKAAALVHSPENFFMLWLTHPWPISEAGRGLDSWLRCCSKVNCSQTRKGREVAWNSVTGRRQLIRNRIRLQTRLCPFGNGITANTCSRSLLLLWIGHHSVLITADTFHHRFKW